MKYEVCINFYDKDFNILGVKECAVFANLADAERYADTLSSDGSAPIQTAYVEERDDNDGFIDFVYERELEQV